MKLSNEVTGKAGIIREQNSVLTIVRNDNGRLVSEKAAVEASRDDIQEAYSKEMSVLKDEFKSIGFKLKNMETMLTAQT
jgi:hypothetical protein